MPPTSTGLTRDVLHGRASARPQRPVRLRLLRHRDRAVGSARQAQPASRCMRLLGGTPPRPNSMPMPACCATATRRWSRGTPPRPATPATGTIKLHEVTREAIRWPPSKRRAPTDARIMLDVNCAWSVPVAAATWRDRCADDGLHVAGRAGLAAGGLRRALPSVRGCGIPIAAGENVAGRVRLQVADRGRRDRHRPAQRHQDRRHRRDAARHRPVRRARRRGGAALARISAPASSRRCTSSPRSRRRPLVEVLWLDMEAQPVLIRGCRATGGRSRFRKGRASAASPIRRCIARYTKGEVVSAPRQEAAHEDRARRNPARGRAACPSRSAARWGRLQSFRLHLRVRALRQRRRRREPRLHAQQPAHQGAARRWSTNWPTCIVGRDAGHDRRFLGAGLEGHQFSRPQGRAGDGHLGARRRAVGRCSASRRGCRCTGCSAARATACRPITAAGCGCPTREAELVAEAERFVVGRLPGDEDAPGLRPIRTPTSRACARCARRIGPDIRLMADANQGLIESAGDPARAARWRSSTSPGSRSRCRPGTSRALPASRPRSTRPIASGETEYTRYGFRRMLELRSRRHADARPAARRRRQRVHARRPHGGELRRAGLEPSVPGDEPVRCWARSPTPISSNTCPGSPTLYNEKLEFGDGNAVVPERPGWGFTFDIEHIAHLESCTHEA